MLSVLNVFIVSAEIVIFSVPSPDQPPSTSSLGTDAQQRTSTSESTSPVIESPSESDTVETCVTCSVYCYYVIGNELYVW